MRAILDVRARDDAQLENKMAQCGGPASPDMPGLYLSGEGAGYAGGIVSAALDGMRVARAIANVLTPAR